MSDLSHLRLEHTEQSVPYTAPRGGGGGEFATPPRDRLPHVRRLKSELHQAEAEADALRGEEDTGDVIAIRSDQNFELKLDSLERRQSGIELVGVSIENGVTVAKVFVPRGKYVRLLAILDRYETEESESGKPKHQELVDSIASIRLATLWDFWQDTIPLPADGIAIWWEVWLRAGEERPDVVHQRFGALARANQMRASEQFVSFPERVVVLAFGTRSDISRSINLLSLIAELRKAKELASDYRELQPKDQRGFIDEALARIVIAGQDAPSVCILDSGVNRGHPLLSASLAEADVLTINPNWGSADDRHQHGTEMAGIALYGNLTQVFNSDGQIVLAHCLESVKFLPPPPGANEPNDYGPFTIQAIARAEIQAPNRNRAICMAVTADDRDLGLPTLWSGTVDKICAGAEEEGDSQRLMFISAGNLRAEILSPEYQYHVWNCDRGGIEDPAQSWNAISVGAFTEMVFIQHEDFRGWQPIAMAGDLCPTSRTSHPWLDEDGRCDWPLKPDIVMEGGNYAVNGDERTSIDDLSLLTTVLPPVGENLLETTRDTSPATALAARMAAMIWSRYPNLWPESVRGLMLHSAQWTDAMLARFPGSEKAQVRKRLRCYGYGVPNLHRALYSAENSVTLLFEGSLQPFHKENNKVRSNEMHVHTLPWPVQVLEGLGGIPVTMRVTLSYFVEPSPGRIGWTRKHRYQSHGLRFDVIRPEEEGEEAFRQRLSRDEWDDPELAPDNVSETRNWTIGDQIRRHGSVHSDWWTGTAAQLARCNLIAVYPVTGWWRERAHLGKFDKRARYSLIVNIEAPEMEVDLYTPIMNESVVTTEV